MKASVLLAATLSLAAGAAAADSLADNPPKSTIICLDVAGKSLPATCKVQASRLDAREDICLCPAGGERVTIPVCAKGVKPPAESAAYEKARRAAVSHGSLAGATFKGQAMCLAARNTTP
ncbi:MAG: hypothetical protein ACXWKV_17745 [Caulobacteraceae bacterium]